MNVTFLVTVNLDDLSNLPEVAGEIEDSLDNFEVISVTPWARPSLQAIGAVPTPSANVPSTTQQPTQINE